MAARIRRSIKRVLKRPIAEYSKEEITLRPTELLRTSIKFDQKNRRWEVTDFVPMSGNKAAFIQHRRFYTRMELLDLLIDHPKLKKVIQKHPELKKHL